MRATPVVHDQVTTPGRKDCWYRKSAQRCDASYKRRMPVVMSVERFEELVSDALDTVPDGLIRLLDNVVILVADESPPGEPELLGLYEGYALTSRGSDYGGVLPDRIMIYRNPILRMCSSEADVVREVRVTVVHEIAHHFGIDDARLHELGWG
jgi:predicted Zn-dependent protease with MMP-like domain